MKVEPKKESKAQRFAKGNAYRALEQTHLIGEGIVTRQTEGESALLDLDDATGNEICKSYLCCVESLLASLDLPMCDRTYR